MRPNLFTSPVRSAESARSNFFGGGGGVAGSEDFACATLPTTPLIFKAKFEIFVTLPSKKSDLK